MSHEHVLTRGDDDDDKLDTVTDLSVCPSQVARRFLTATKETSGGVLATK
jgi:hypothetical protein